jgi:hypothetical protein
MLMLVAVPMIRSDLIDGGSLAGKPTRTQAAEWMVSNIPVGSKILMEVYTSILPKERFNFYSISSQGGLVHFIPEDSYKKLFSAGGHIGELGNITRIHAEDVQYAVMSQMYSRYKAEKEKYPQVVARYEEIMAMGELVYQVEAIPGESSGPPIRIYQFSKIE